MTDLYQELILDELRNPHNYGEMDDADVIREETNASCGDAVSVFIKLSEDKKTITAISWIGAGCAISQSAMSLLSSEIHNKQVDTIKLMSKEAMLELLGLPEIVSGREKCLMLGLKAVQRAIGS